MGNAAVSQQRGPTARMSNLSCAALRGLPATKPLRFQVADIATRARIGGHEPGVATALPTSAAYLPRTAAPDQPGLGPCRRFDGALGARRRDAPWAAVLTNAAISGEGGFSIVSRGKTDCLSSDREATGARSCHAAMGNMPQ